MEDGLPGHYPGCECSPEVALKIQFLHLVHSLCDHSDYKHLISSREWDELGRILPPPTPVTVKPSSSLMDPTCLTYHPRLHLDVLLYLLDYFKP